MAGWSKPRTTGRVRWAHLLVRPHLVTGRAWACAPAAVLHTAGRAAAATAWLLRPRSPHAFPPALSCDSPPTGLAPSHASVVSPAFVECATSKSLVSDPRMPVSPQDRPPAHRPAPLPSPAWRRRSPSRLRLAFGTVPANGAPQAGAVAAPPGAVLAESRRRGRCAHCGRAFVGQWARAASTLGHQEMLPWAPAHAVDAGSWLLSAPLPHSARAAGARGPGRPGRAPLRLAQCRAQGCRPHPGSPGNNPETLS